MSVTVHVGLKISEWVSTSTLSDLVSVHVCEANGINIFFSFVWWTRTKTAPSYVFAPVQHREVTVEPLRLTPGNPELQTWEKKWGKKPFLSTFPPRLWCSFSTKLEPSAGARPHHHFKPFPEKRWDYMCLKPLIHVVHHCFCSVSIVVNSEKQSRIFVVFDSNESNSCNTVLWYIHVATLSLFSVSTENHRASRQFVSSMDHCCFFTPT